MSAENRNLFRHLDGKQVRLAFSDLGKRLEVEGTLDAHSMNNMVRVGGWIVGVGNIISLVDIEKDVAVVGG